MRIWNFILCFSVIFLALIVGLGYGRYVDNHHQHPSKCDPWRKEGCRSEKVLALARLLNPLLPLPNQQTANRFCHNYIDCDVSSIYKYIIQHVALKIISDNS